MFFMTRFPLRIKILTEMIGKISDLYMTTRIGNILNAFDAIYRDLKRYNSTYLSKFLLIIWFINGFGVVLLIYITCFEPIRVEMEVVLVLGAITQVKLDYLVQVILIVSLSRAYSIYS